jgi:carnitine 3-dehydrogenase
MEGWRDDLGAPNLTPEVGATLTEGIATAAGGRDIAALAAERDRFLIDLLSLKKHEGG